MPADALWYLARGSGVTALVLLTVVVVLGIVTRSRGTLGAVTGRSRLVVTSVHRSAALAAVVFLVIHLVTLLFDPYAELKLVDLVVPFTSTYRPLFVGLGALALDLVLALVVTSLLRDRLGLRAWRAVHLAAYALWPIALVHGIGAGSDAAAPWLIGIDIACVVAVLAALATHPALTGSTTDRARRRAPQQSAPPLAGAGAREATR